MPLTVGDEIEITLCWNSTIGKAVGTFRATVVGITHNETVDLTIDRMIRVAPSNPNLGSVSSMDEIADEADAFRKSSYVVPLAVTDGAPMYVENPLGK